MEEAKTAHQKRVEFYGGEAGYKEHMRSIRRNVKSYYLKDNPVAVKKMLAKRWKKDAQDPNIPG